MNQADTAWILVATRLLKIIGLARPLRATTEEQTVGLGVTQHGEEAYLRGGTMAG
jgi:ammonia channel protein AmtB